MKPGTIRIFKIHLFGSYIVFTSLQYALDVLKDDLTEELNEGNEIEARITSEVIHRGRVREHA